MAFNRVPSHCSPMKPGREYGQIEMIIGPMFSGKSTELMRRIRRYQIATYRVLVIKYSKDTRYDSEMFSTHDGAKLNAIKCEKLRDVMGETEDYQVIAIDEGQFFPDIVEFCENLADQGKFVIVAALDGTFQRKPFQRILDLIPLAESVIKLTAVCMNCRGEAAFTRRLGDEKEVELIGSEDKYMSVCRACYHQPEIQSPHKTQCKRPYVTIEGHAENNNGVDEKQHKRRLF